MKKSEEKSIGINKIRSSKRVKKRRKEEFGLGKFIVFPIAVAKKRKLLEAVGRPSGALAFAESARMEDARDDDGQAA